MKLKNVLMISLMTILLLLLSSINVFAKTVIVDTDTLNFRKEASKESAVIELLDKGEKLEYIETSGEWYKVKKNGVTGYVSKDFTKLQEDEKETTTQKPAETEKPAENTTTTTTQNETKKEEETKTEEQVPPPAPQPTQMKVSKDSSIYILPLINANKIQSIKKDSNVKILSRTNGWAYVETDEMMGWIRQDALTDPSVVSDDRDTVTNNDTTTVETSNTAASTEDKEITAKTMYVNTSSIYVRKGPGTTYDSIDSLVLNNAVKVVAENGDWYKVEIDGKKGYIAKRLLSDSKTSTTRGDTQRTEAKTEEKPKAETTTTAAASTTTASSKGQQIVDYAKKYLGKKYVYGGSGPNTFDCSGFTMYVYKNFGVTLSHSARAQSKVGKYVSKDSLQPGDLVFFTDYETGVGIGHVGIYVGNGDFIHASSGTGYCVKISTLTSGSYLKRYETARRIF